MALVRVSGPTAEPVTLDEVRAFVNLDSNNQEPAAAAPSAALASPAAPGNVDVGAHRYLVVLRTATGRTEAGAPSAAVTVADKTVNGQVALTAIAIGSGSVVAREIYRTAAGGSTYLLLATLADNTATTYTDNIADAALGAGAPATNTTDDWLLAMLLASARQYGETLTRRAFMPQTWDLVRDGFPGWALTVPKSPLQSVTSINYVDSNGVAQLLDQSQYLVDAKSEPGRIAPAYGLVWPVTRWQMGAVTVRYVCGYADAASVPECIKNWLLLRTRTLWENRAQLNIDTRTMMVELPPSYADGMLDPVCVDDFSWAVE